MTSAIGFLLFVLGMVALYAWAPAIIPFLKGVTAFALLFSGVMCLVVGLGGRKAKKDFKKAMDDQPSVAETLEGSEA